MRGILVINTELLERWITALRSGAYEQGRMSLRERSGERYCCLGVLCDVYNPELWQWHHNYGWVYHEDEGVRSDGVVSEGMTNTLPPRYIRDELGLQNNVVYEGEHLILSHVLTQMNDFESRDFNEIADYLEWSYSEEDSKRGAS
jgi:hypothetical protein